VVVLSPERVLFDGQASAVVVPAYDGLVGILPRHAPFVALLGRGVTRVTAKGAEARFSVAGGLVQVARDVVRVVAERAATMLS
jgi:F-type H+-transporting ATPase subunit epsilon